MATETMVRKSVGPEDLDGTTDGDQDSNPSRKWDAELLCMGKMIRLLDELDEEAKPRVVAWLNSRFQSAITKF